ncbi:lipid-A-disaccharide synthase [Roseibacterium sp. SDUM158016]|uniref:lipid-A-disaccharide synthase n=1 Tax=Roseicyclus sediminis TaxID=2980997 RepID=UPI0021CE3F86|nr:lipid-A-disaccharide synthase [Roseibacterium sp. SDUM158016]MCU4654550.1 lipid-A-disaccharide synthase [Roseibacterium sp. SDUM158016]
MRLFLVAGEASGDRLGAALIRGLREVSGEEIELHGIGGPLMQAEGLTSLFPMEELSVMGLTEILPRLRSLLARVSETAEEVIRLKPDALITIDSPEFSLRVAGRVKARAAHMPTIHYVAPTVWAWRPKRARKMARSIDHVLALFPFEPAYMQAEGMSCDFVGHPVTTEPVASAAEAAAFREAHKIGAEDKLILVLPGSRRSEVDRLAPVFGEALRPVLAAHPGARLVLPTTETVAVGLPEKLRGWPAEPVILDPRGRRTEDFLAEKRAAFAAADVALAASGTVSLELAASETPMVVAYDMSWLSRKIIGAMLRVDTVTLVNLVSDTRAVPEFLGPECRPGPIAGALKGLLADEGARVAQLDAMAATMLKLGRGGEAPGLRAARSVLKVI